MDHAADPNGDGKTRDRVDIINMSLGRNYGQPFDADFSMAVQGATELGILTVAGADNDGDKPYIVGTPSAAPSALAVAQTQVPSAGLQLLSIGGNDIAGVFQPWSVVTAANVSGPLRYGDGAGGNRDGCAPFAPGSLTGAAPAAAPPTTPTPSTSTQTTPDRIALSGRTGGWRR
jgi:hypothetical protein